MENERTIEMLRAEFLSQPVLGSIIREVQNDQDCVSWIGLSGSKARAAELGTVSDDDLVVILGENNLKDPLNMEKMDRLLDAVNKATEKIIIEKSIVPIFASTIRLEDAQFALASMVNQSGLPLHMVHLLVYPSAKAAVAFEPPLLNRGLFGRSLTLFGKEQNAKEVVNMVENKSPINDANLSLGGLDGISDNFRMIRLNQHIMPVKFLGPQMIHVLDYTLKWIMAAEVERRSGIECGTWKEILDGFSCINGGEKLISIVEWIREERSSGARDLVLVERLTREVISLWPLLSKIRTEKT
ncbi:hypothetical protein D4S03_00370 [bacterium]|nr:MAG: hypothetical protein D4S03_00370 [bacterium]